jgi:hypothetical protein
LTKAKGTLPFLATHLLTTIETEIPRHSPVHDLESCLWVSMWVAVHAILDRTKDDGGHRAEDERVLGNLMPKHSDMDGVASAKGFLLSFMQKHLSNNFNPFRPILLQLASVAKSYYEASMDKQQGGKQFTTEEIEKAFAMYIKIFEEYMPQEESWDYLPK